MSGNFDPNPSGSPEGQPFSAGPDSIVEQPGSDGVATQLAGIAAEMITAHPEHIDENGVLRLETLDGKTMRVRRLDYTAEGVQPYGSPQLAEAPAAPSRWKVAAAGLKNWLQRRRATAPAPENAEPMQQYRISLGDTTRETNLDVTVIPNGTIQAQGESKLLSDDTSMDMRLRGIFLSSAVQHAARLLGNSYPADRNDAITERQKGSCSHITGREAAAVQRVIEPMLNTPLDTIGHTDEKRREQGYESPVRGQMDAPNRRFDGPWSVEEVKIIQRHAGEAPLLAGPIGRTVLSWIRFQDALRFEGDELVQTPLLVRVMGVYDAGSRLVNAAVEYLTASPEGNRQLLALNPAERAVVHTAILNQVTPAQLVPQATPTALSNLNH